MKSMNSNRIALILSLLMAVIAWSYVMAEVNPDSRREFRNIPVTLLNADALTQNDLVIVEPEKPMVTVSLLGKRNTLNRIEPGQIIAEANMRGYNEGAVRVPILIREPAETTLYHTSESEIVFTLEKIVERTVPIQVTTEGVLADDFKYSSSADPNTVTLKGRRSLINRVHKAVLQVDVTEKTESFTGHHKIILLDADDQPVTGIQMDHDTASASVEVRRVKEVPIVLMYTGSLPEDVTVIQEQVEPKTILITGPDSIVSSIENIQTEPINRAELVQSTSRTVALQLPEGVTADESVVPLYTVRLRTPVSQTVLIGRSAIAWKGLARNLVGEVEEGGLIQIRLSGSEETMEALKDSDVHLYFDASGLEAGEHELTVQMEPIEGVQLKEDLPNLTVTLSER